MSNLHIDQRSIQKLLADNKVEFIIPDYQRPYAWTVDECTTLWNDIKEFAIPEDDCDRFDEDSEYFLGPIVTFKNQDGKLEVIDGQQRLTTITLLLRAFYQKFGKAQDTISKKTRERMAKCIWKMDEFETIDFRSTKVNSLVATDNDLEEFRYILSEGETPEHFKSNYAVNYRYFVRQISEFIDLFPNYMSHLPSRMMNNCILLPIEAESQDTALKIFSTLNNRGKSLADSDIFKAQFYRFYSDRGEKDSFIENWRELEELCDTVFQSSSNNPMDELFTRYMYYERSKQGIKASTTEALRKFYERNSYAILKDTDTLGNLEHLMHFWNSIYIQDADMFSSNVLRRLSVLNMAPNGIWTYIMSVYFLKESDEDGMLDEGKLLPFLNKLIGFVWAYSFTNPGVNALRTPIYAEMVNIHEGKPVDFSDYRFDEVKLRTLFVNYQFTNQRPLTKSMLAWWAFQQESQEPLPTDVKFDIEHIYARNRNAYENSLKDPRNVDVIGNKSLLEKTINIRASDYRFCDKVKYYTGVENGSKSKPGTMIQELRSMADRDDFTESDILERGDTILEGFIQYLRDNDLLQN